MTDQEKLDRIISAINAMTDSYIDEGNAALAEKTNKLLDIEPADLVQLYDLLDRWLENKAARKDA